MIREGGLILNRGGETGKRYLSRGFRTVACHIDGERDIDTDWFRDSSEAVIDMIFADRLSLLVLHSVIA